jgi:hypothetical protein
MWETENLEREKLKDRVEEKLDTKKEETKQRETDERVKAVFRIRMFLSFPDP